MFAFQLGTCTNRHGLTRPWSAFNLFLKESYSTVYVYDAFTPIREALDWLVQENIVHHYAWLEPKVFRMKASPEYLHQTVALVVIHDQTDAVNFRLNFPKFSCCPV